MADIATLTVSINGRDTGVEAMLAKLEKRLRDLDKASGPDPFKAPADSARKASGSFLAFQQSIARLEAAQGNLAGAAQRLRNVLAQQTTTTTQTINAERQLLAVETQLASGTSALGGHFKSLQSSMGAIGGAIGGLPGQLLGVSTGIGAITVAIGAAVGVVKSFGDAFVFKANLDATTKSIHLQLQGVRDSNVVFAEGQQFAAKYGLTQQELTDSIQSSIGVMRQSTATTTDLLETLSRLQVLAPEKPISEAARALRELASGDTASIKELFNIAAADANRMKAEIVAGGDAVQVLSSFLDKTGISMDTLSARTEGAKGKLIEMAQAQEQLTLAQAEFAQGPGLTLLEGKINLIRGATRLLSGDFDAMAQSSINADIAFKASSAGVVSYINALLGGASAAEAQAASTQMATAATTVLIGAVGSASGGTFELAGATNVLVGSMSAESAAAAEAAAAATANADAMADQVIKTQTASLGAQKLAETQSLLARIGGAVQAGQITAGQGALQFAQMTGIAIEKARELLSLQAQLAGAAAAATKAKLGTQTARQLTGADSEESDIRRQRSAGIQEDRNARVKASGDAAAAERNYQQTLGNTAPAMAHARAELAQLTKGSAAYINKQNEIAKLQQQSEHAAKKGGGAPKLSDQTKLNNQLLAGQEVADNKMEDAAQAHADAVEKINSDFYDKMLQAQRAFNLDSLDQRVGFYDALGGIEDHGLQQAMSAKYEAAALKSQEVAKAKGADAGQAFLEASRAAIEKEAKIQDEINKVSNKKDKKTFDPDRAEFLRGILAQQQAADAERLRQIEENGSAITSAKDKQLADEAGKFDTAQGKIITASDRAADRQILNAERSGKAVDGVIAKVDTLTTKYDGLGTAGARAGITPAATASSAATGVPAASTVTPAAAPTADPIALALDGLIAAVNAVRDATTSAGKGVEGAVGRIAGKFAS